MKLISILSLVLAAQVVVANEIAITFDDIPTGDSVLMTGNERTIKLINGLKKADVADALFFVQTGNITNNSEARLFNYVESGHHLASHSHSHRSANKISSNEYMLDIYHAHLLLKKYPNVLPLHRFPYLHYGNTKQVITENQQRLSELQYKNGYITVDNYDWYMNSLLLHAQKAGKAIDYVKLGELYVQVIWQAITFYDDIAKESLGRSPKHVLLLHENDIAALYMPELIAHIRSKGWKIISAQEAYQDPIAKRFPQVEFHKQGRVAALAHEKGVPISKLKHPAESQAYLDNLFTQAQVFK